MSFGKNLDEHAKKLEAVKGELNRVEYCIEHGVDCNDWEDDFLANIKDWLMRGRSLSSAQAETLEKIEYKVEFGLEAYWEEYGHGERD